MLSDDVESILKKLEHKQLFVSYGAEMDDDGYQELMKKHLVKKLQELGYDTSEAHTHVQEYLDKRNEL